ncbi:TPA: hypothetical protein ACR3Z0_000017 [Bacillus thuringiensis]|uniref:Uncharacterized protein n=3 Tax=Bacillus thuringiensis TaxID=1428 RepID=A0A9X6QAZ1_BACTU|nr:MULTISPECIES: hypothetical protein [Bacillus]KMP91946.1 hypothetical protein TU66_34695 [Bacillus cereus]MCC3872920.1 hypothetical protein [Bacillus thuringiensis]MCC3879213.1 hypothetical protein [Bacillus thuringiensis]MCC3883139.1 hypothetical protein [Bacillus thuringiensis]MCC3893365.1 hypothetical protein [Bacillus thuringiensis]
MLNPFEDVIGEECYKCENPFPESDMSKIYISGLERTLCKQCREQLEQKVKVLDFRVIHDVLKELIKGFGREKVRQFDLVTAKRYVIDNGVDLMIEKRGGKFNQEPLGECVSLSTKELITVIEFLMRKMNPNLWMNAVIGNVLDQQMIITLSPIEGESND